jgi:hypothetical protein
MATVANREASKGKNRMRKTVTHPTVARTMRALGAACGALFLAQLPAHAASDVTNFNVKNCTPERIFICSFDKTDSLMKVPYKAARIQPTKRKEFGCASLGRCKVIIGISKKTSKSTLSTGMQAALGTGAVVAVAAAGVNAGVYVAGNSALASTQLAPFYVAKDAASLSLVGGAAIGFAVVAVTVGGAVAAIEVADGWKDGEVCNQVRRAAEKAGMKPRDFMQNGEKYVVEPQYAVDEKGNPYLNADGTAVFTYKATKGNSCPASLKTQLIQ